MSSFVSVRSSAKPIRLGNPSFKLLLAAIKEEGEVNPAIKSISEKNPIAEIIGLLSLEGMESEIFGEFRKLVRGLIDSTVMEPSTDAGFDRHEDFVRCLDELEALLS